MVVFTGVNVPATVAVPVPLNRMSWPVTVEEAPREWVPVENSTTPVPEEVTEPVMVVPPKRNCRVPVETSTDTLLVKAESNRY